VGTEEPLQTLVQHFAECVLKGQRPLTDGHSGLRVVELLEATDRSLALNGAPVAPGDSSWPQANQESRKVA
jgi:predicted dehydrogenase